MTQAVKRACDACHRRKVKCDGINPCRNCTAAQLSCTYNAVPQKKGPKGSRAKVISELRETQRQTSLSAKVQNRINGTDGPTTNPSLNPAPGLLSNEMVKTCVSFYFDHLYLQIPILDRQQVEQQMMYLERDHDVCCLMTSLCAFVMLQPGMFMPPNDPFNLDMNPGAALISSQLLLEDCLRVRKGYDYCDGINLNVLATNFFIFGCYYALEMHDKAWYYLREATTMVHMLGMNKEEHYASLEIFESARRRRLYWLLFITERAYAIQRHRPMSLQATIRPPTMGDDPSDLQAPLLEVFILLVNLYQPFDEALLATWNNARRHLSAPHITGLTKQLGDLSQQYLCQDPNLIDFRTNKQWLENALWLLSHGSNEETMGYAYSMNMSRDLLVNSASHFSNQGVEAIGPGLVEHLMKTCLSMMGVLINLSPNRDPYSVGPREHLDQLLKITAMIRHGGVHFMPLLLSKVSEVLPRLVNPMLQNPPENNSLATIDIFDGFGNAGMAQIAMQMPSDFGQKFAVEDYEKTFTVDEYENKYQVDMCGNSPDSLPSSNASHGTSPRSQQPNDINTSFVSSPASISPGMSLSYGYACHSFGIP